MLSRDTVLSYLREYKTQHITDYYISKLGLFGSMARDEHNLLSDIDIVVEFSKPNLFVQAGIMQDLIEKFNTNVDVIALSDRINPKLLNRIKKDVIYV